jgi:catechol 2,3-dioxygenase-like lactoylglutathione lyase family enzyme
MPIRGLHHVNLRGVPAQVREMRDFYCNVLGLTEGPRPPFLSTGAWLYAGELPLVHLVEDVSGPSHANRMDVLAVDHVAFACQGFDEMRGRLEARGVAYTSHSRPDDGGASDQSSRPLRHEGRVGIQPGRSGAVVCRRRG